MKKIAALQSLRALAFLEIFLAHCGVSPYMGALGVSIFIVLSGFCMAINYIPRIDIMPETLRGSVRFAVSKVKKLYLLHVIMTLCAVALRGVPQSVPDVLRLVINILLLQSLFPSSSVYFAYNGIAWYLSTYMFICLAAPFILRRISAASGKRLAIYASVSACTMLIPAALLSALRVPVGDDFAKWFTYICPAYRLLDFTLGAILGQVYLTRGAAEGARPRLLMHAVIAAGLLAAWLLIPAAGFDGYRYTLAFLLAAMLLVFIFARGGDSLPGFLAGGLLITLGDLSSSAFLIHQVVIQACRMLMRGVPSMQGRLGTTVLAAVSLAVTLAAAKLYELMRGKLRAPAAAGKG